MAISSPEFLDWFRGSKVIDDAGLPLVVYHGTGDSFDAFDPERSGRNYFSTGGHRGFFFSSRPGTASVYAEKVAGAYLNPDDPEAACFGDGTANIMPAYLHLQNPVVIKTAMSPDKYFDYNRDRIYARASKKGADGIIVHGLGKFPRAVYVALDPSQIKSAIGNCGRFEAGNPNICA